MLYVLTSLGLSLSYHEHHPLSTAELLLFMNIILFQPPSLSASFPFFFCFSTFFLILRVLFLPDIEEKYCRTRGLFPTPSTEQPNLACSSASCVVGLFLFLWVLALSLVPRAMLWLTSLPSFLLPSLACFPRCLSPSTGAELLLQDRFCCIPSNTSQSKCTDLWSGLAPTCWFVSCQQQGKLVSLSPPSKSACCRVQKKNH